MTIRSSGQTFWLFIEAQLSHFTPAASPAHYIITIPHSFNNTLIPAEVWRDLFRGDGPHPFCTFWRPWEQTRVIIRDVRAAGVLWSQRWQLLRDFPNRVDGCPQWPLTSMVVMVIQKHQSFVKTHQSPALTSGPEINESSIFEQLPTHNKQ